MMPLQVKLQRVVKATKDEAMTVEQAADYLKVPKQYIPVLVARSDDLKMIGDETIIAKRDKMNGWLVGACVGLFFFAVSVLPGMLG
ncbi:YrzE family protein [Bacillus velezensis]|uniref:YrzE family protein n=1 Tax=Bacillus velezensis TaxID=492670 RepID=UPI00280F822A|nr:YrzE family protein [Bacillus velezensis]MDQ9147356.1 YrzE family protein [Bacillus velezensis]MEC2185098.1 YrzE family protein [Bacillus velezensis]MED3451325.1 YrzE family protein [Bacillus velezensis]